MDDVGRKRAGAAVRDRLAARELTITDASQKAGIGARTLGALIAGERWPTAETRRRLEDALGWPEGELVRRARGERPSLSAYTNLELLAELMQREREKP